MQGVQQARRILAAEPLRTLLAGPELSPGPEVADAAALRNALPGLVRTSHHPVGTCWMGPDLEDGAVVDASGSLYGVEGLSVVDASIMPRISRANTHLAGQRLARSAAAATTTEQPGH